MKKAFVVSIICGLCIIFCISLFLRPDFLRPDSHDRFKISYIIDNWGSGDWDIHLFWLDSPITTIKEYHQFPLWNPWDGGGMVLHQHHEIPFLTPFLFLYFLFPTPHAIKISILLHYIIALTGMYIIGRKIFKINNLFLILIPSSIFVFNGSFTLHISEGHTWILPFAYIPFVYYFFDKYVNGKAKKDMIICSLFICLMIFEVGTYPVPLIMLSLIIYSLSMFVLRINKDYLPALIEVGILSLLFSSIKMIPIIDYMMEHPRHFPTMETIPLHALYKIFLWRNQSLWTFRNGFEGQKYLWHEYGCYIGVGLLGFFLIALVINIMSIKKNRGRIPWIICFIVFFLFFLGDFHEFAPYTILKNVPFFSSMRVSGRYLIMLTFIASILSFALSQRIDNILNNSRGKATRNLFTVIIIFFSFAVIFDLVRVNTVSFLQAFRFNPQEIAYYSDEFSNKYEYQSINALPSYGAYSAMYPALKMNIATNCALKANPPQKGFDSNNPLVLSTDNSTKISNIKFTPNKMYFDVETPVRSTIVLNQNYVRGWKFSLPGVSINNKDHKPAVELEKGKYENLYFYYFPDSIIIGAILTVIGIAASWLVIKFRWKLLM